MARVRGSSVTAAAVGGVESVVDFNNQLGYALGVGLQLDLPVQAKAAEHALAEQLVSQLSADELGRQQRRGDVEAAVSQAIGTLQAARIAMVAAKAQVDSKREALREALIRFTTVNTTGSSGFDDVQAQRAALYAAQKTYAQAEAAVWTDAAALLAPAPGACGNDLAAVSVSTAPPAPVPTPMPTFAPAPMPTLAPTPMRLVARADADADARADAGTDAIAHTRSDA